MNRPTPLWLASRSPRRKQMLEDAGFDVQIHPPDFDDGKLQRGNVTPREWVKALACLKARRVWNLLRTAGNKTGIVLGADTMCAMDDQTLGQPRDADDARRMLQLLRNAEHETITGVCLISLNSGRHSCFSDAAHVHVGAISETQIEQYIVSQEWRGKAGAYNLSERIAAGWPIQCVGDPTTVMGLPMKRIMSFRFFILD